MKYLYIILFSLLPFTMQAQQNTVAAGNSTTGSSGSFSFSVGQVDYLSANSDMGVAIAGIQQPFDDEDYDYNKMCDDVQITIAPNPTPDFLFVFLNDDFVRYRYTISDAVGRVYTESELTEGYEKIDLMGLLNGVYFLKVYCNDDEPVVFKIVKRQ